MDKKIRWSTFTAVDMDAASNKVEIGGGPHKDLEVSVIDEEGNKIKRYKEVLRNEHKILITLKFQWENSWYQDASPNHIEYFIKKSDDYWKVNKDRGGIIVKQAAEFEKAKKEMHKNLLKKEFGDEWINKSSRGQVVEADAKETDMKYIILEDGKGDYKVNIYDGDTNNSMEFQWEQVKVEPQFWQNKQFDFDIMFNIKYQKEEEKSQLTKGWIAFFVILSVIVILGIIFRKRIWRWIKGEREQEKKVREQIDIF